MRKGFVLAAAILSTIYFFAATTSIHLNFMYSVLPSSAYHIYITALAVALMWAGYFSKARGVVLAGAIALCFAEASFLLMGWGLTLPLIFAFVGFARMKEKEPSVVHIHTNTTPIPALVSRADEISKYKELLDSGAITENEFKTLKEKALL